MVFPPFEVTGSGEESGVGSCCAWRSGLGVFTKLPLLVQKPQKESQVFDGRRGYATSWKERLMPIYTIVSSSWHLNGTGIKFVKHSSLKIIREVKVGAWVQAKALDGGRSNQSPADRQSSNGLLPWHSLINWRTTLSSSKSRVSMSGILSLTYRYWDFKFFNLIRHWSHVFSAPSAHILWAIKQNTWNHNNPFSLWSWTSQKILECPSIEPLWTYRFM